MQNQNLKKTTHAQILVNKKNKVVIQRIYGFFYGVEFREIQEEMLKGFMDYNCTKIVYDTRLAKPIRQTDFDYLIGIFRKMASSGLTEITCVNPQSPLTFYVILKFKNALAGVVDINFVESYDEYLTQLQ